MFTLQCTLCDLMWDSFTQILLNYAYALYCIFKFAIISIYWWVSQYNWSYFNGVGGGRKLESSGLSKVERSAIEMTWEGMITNLICNITQLILKVEWNQVFQELQDPIPWPLSSTESVCKLQAQTNKCSLCRTRSQHLYVWLWELIDEYPKAMCMATKEPSLFSNRWSAGFYALYVQSAEDQIRIN